MKDRHTHFMRLAYELSLKNRHLPDPNPCVGCVIVHGDKIIGQGATQVAGSNHAEIEALHDVEKRGLGALLKDSTLYVTLEPCSHHGRTPPCVDALIRSGIREVAVALPDPNPLVGGNGISSLRSHGIDVHVGYLMEEVLELNVGFFSRMLFARPWIRTKIASSLDGHISLDNGKSKWITNEQARHDGHKWRSRASMIFTGVGTVLADNPRMNVRYVETHREPLVAILDSDFRTLDNPNLNIFSNPKIIICGNASALSNFSYDRGALPNNIDLIGIDTDSNGLLNLRELIEKVGIANEINEIHVEAGSGLNTSLYEAGLIDEYLWYFAPMILGDCNAPFNISPLESIPEHDYLEMFDLTKISNNVRLRIRNSVRWKTLLNSLKEMVRCLQA